MNYFSDNITAELEFERFLSWLRARYKIETTQSWASLILFHSVDERDALDRLFDLWEKFQNSDRTPTPMLRDRNLPETNVFPNISVSQKV